MVSIIEVTDAASKATFEFQETGNKSAEPNGTMAPGSSSDVPNTKSKRTRARRPSIRKSSAHRQERRLLRRYHGWKSAHLYLARYSIEKMLAFESYRQVASPMRVLFVVALTPLPALIVVLLLAVIPIQSPETSATTQIAFFVQSWLSFGAMTFGMLTYMRSALALPQNIHSHRQCALISLLTAGSYEFLNVFVSMLWRFPIPLGGIVGLPVYAALFVVFHILIFKWQLRHYENRLRGYHVMYLVQLLTFFVYYGVSIVFKTASGWRKGFIAVAFAMLRPILKGTLRLIAFSVEDMSTELTFCIVEVFAAYFQNVCLQSACLASYGGLLIAASSLQAGLEVLMFAKHEFVVDGHQATRTAFKIVESALFPGALVNGMDEKVDHNGINSTISHRSISVPRSSLETTTKSATFVKRSNTNTNKVACIDSFTAMSLDVATIELGEMVHEDPELRSQSSCTAKTFSRRTFIDDMEFAHRHHAKLLSQTLELMNAAEVLVSSHYFDISCSVIYGLYVLVVYHSPSAVYFLPFIGLTPEKLWRSVLLHGIFAIVAGLILFCFFAFIQAKFGFSIFYQLAFALEKYWMSVQGKLIATFALIFILDTVHQGMDFSLKFDWEQIIAGTTCP